MERSAFASDEEYEKMRERIIDGLLNVRDHDKQVVIWSKRREDIYKGNSVKNYPDIVYRMLPEYGVDRGLFGKRLFGINAMHVVFSGCLQFLGFILGN